MDEKEKVAFEAGIKAERQRLMDAFFPYLKSGKLEDAKPITYEDIKRELND